MFEVFQLFFTTNLLLNEFAGETMF